MSEIIFPWMDILNTKKLICSGGVFLNVKLNQFLWDAKQVKDLWIYPNCGDAGLTVGACLNIYHSNFDQQINKLDNLYKGEEYNNEYIKNILDERSIAYQYFKNIAKETAFYLNKNYVVGWFQGRMEAGPRALGNRSILMSPLIGKNQDLINKKIKFRESFRPFCPSVI